MHGDYVEAILKNDKNETVGIEGKIYGTYNRYSTKFVLEYKNNGGSFDNANIDCNGFVSAKHGNLKVIRVVSRPNAVQQRDISNTSKLINKNIVTLYHGTKDKKLVPKFGLGKLDTDYGVGFYLTDNIEMAREWSYTSFTRGSSSYCFAYEFNFSGLNILDLTKEHIVYWLALLLKNRSVSILDDITRDRYNIAKEEFLVKYDFDISKYDVIIGYRADDGFYSYIVNFMLGNITLESLDKSFRYGDLGLQVALKSKLAYNNLKYLSYEEVSKEYSTRYSNRISEANKQVSKLVRENIRSRGTRISDILREW